MNEISQYVTTAVTFYVIVHCVCPASTFFLNYWNGWIFNAYRPQLANQHSRFPSGLKNKIHRTETALQAQIIGVNMQIIYHMSSHKYANL
jgi:hypothetical protein